MKKDCWNKVQTSDLSGPWMSLSHFVWLSNVRQINLTTFGFLMGFVGFTFCLREIIICCSLLVVAKLVIQYKNKKRRRNLDNCACPFHWHFWEKQLSAPRVRQDWSFLRWKLVEAFGKQGCGICPQPCAFQLSHFRKEQGCLARHSSSAGERSRW